MEQQELSQHEHLQQIYKTVLYLLSFNKTYDELKKIETISGYSDEKFKKVDFKKIPFDFPEDFFTATVSEQKERISKIKSNINHDYINNENKQGSQKILEHLKSLDNNLLIGVDLHFRPSEDNIYNICKNLLQNKNIELTVDKEITQNGDRLSFRISFVSNLNSFLELLNDKFFNKMAFQSAQFELNIPLPNQDLNFDKIKQIHNSEDVIFFKGLSTISSSFDLHYFKYGIEKSEEIIANSILNSIHRVNDSKIPNQREELIESLKLATQQDQQQQTNTNKKALK